MNELFFIITPIALLDSLSLVPVSIVPLIILLGSKRPIFYTIMFMLGILVVYIPFGILLTLGMDSTFNAFSESVSNWIKQEPDCIDLLVQLLIGIALLAFGYQIARSRASKANEKPELKITAMAAFSFSALLMITGLWGALPYFAAVDQILRAEISSPMMIMAIVFYNLVFITPLIALYVTGSVLGPKAKPLFDKIIGWLLKFGKRAITFAFYALGLLLISDAVGWYFDYPIIPIGTNI